MKKVLIWIPFAEKTNWRGEGIAFSVEKILFNSDNVVQYDIYTAKSVAGEILDSFEEKQLLCNARFLNGVKRKVKKEAKIIEIDLIQNRGIAAILFEKLEGYLNKVSKYTKILNKFIITINRDWLFSRYDAVWVPSPIFKIKSTSNRDKIFYNFWDPFVFEYGFFSFYQKYFFYSQISFIKKNKYKIITQSEFNKKYLNEVLGFGVDSINVVRLGGADDQLLNNHSTSLCKVPFHSYPQRSSRYRIYLDTIVNELDNKSALFRSMSRLTKDTKVIFVSTQNRPYKGLCRFLNIYVELLKEQDIFLITTADVSELLKNEFPELTESVCILKRVTNNQHKFLIQNSDLIIHPSYVEGGQGAFPMFEAAAMGVPSLVNWGRHIEEFKKFYPNENSLDKISVDFDKDLAVKEKICDLLYNREKINENISAVAKLNYKWSDTAMNYVRIFTGKDGIVNVD